MESPKGLKIRTAEPIDAESLVSLSRELGYLVTPDKIISKLKSISNNDEEEVFVAQYEDVIGWMHIALSEPLESPGFVEIKGIVVNEQYRGRGIGTELINTAVEWAKDKKCGKLRVRTNIKRTETRKYYKKAGFDSKKIQEVFEMVIQ